MTCKPTEAEVDALAGKTPVAPIKPATLRDVLDKATADNRLWREGYDKGRREGEARGRKVVALDDRTLRDLFAAFALAGLLANPREDYAATTREEKAVEAVRQADAMLAARDNDREWET